MMIAIKQVDAFTDRAFGGNPAGVVIDADGLSDELMQQIANEMNLSETAFVLPSEEGDFRIRWFTTEKEVLFCGHATVATIHTLAEEKRFGMEADGSYEFKIETMLGLLPVKVVIKNSKAQIALESPQAEFMVDKLDRKALAAALEIKESDFLDIDFLRDKTIDYVFIPVRDMATLQKVQYNYSKLKEFGAENSIKGFTVFTTETIDEDAHVHSRFFSPYYDVIEDPVTGSANGPLAIYLLKNNLIDSQLQFVKAEQGDILNRPGRLLVELNEEAGDYKSVLHGGAVTVLEGHILA